ncbi:hypothetical protein [Nocardia carnea]|uniref:hypothetical protein n=1 Tax=Nocardia carnea TaxID=37328 RepID=UPI002458069F|nr:hypothetical protein [Nocardia carnea]
MLVWVRRILVTAVTGTALTIPGGLGSAVAQPVAPSGIALNFPAIGGVEIGPGGVPGGSLQPVTVVAAPAAHIAQHPPAPPAVQFTVPDPAAYHYQYPYRYLSVSWRNLETGKVGEVQLRHWCLPDYPIDGYPSTLPTTAIAHTGAGPIVATVTVLRTQWEAAPLPISVIPGLNIVAV